MRYGNEQVAVAMNCYFTLFGVKQRLFKKENAAIAREAPEHRLAGARRKAVTLRFAHAAAARLHMLLDPQGAGGRMG